MLLDGERIHDPSPELLELLLLLVSVYYPVNHMKLTDKVFLVGGSGYGYSAPGDCNVYLVDCGRGLSLVDTGGGRGVPMILDNIKRMGFDPSALEVAFVTHCHYDHIGGNHALKDATGCKIAAHESEKEDIETLSELTLYQQALDSGLSFEPTSVDICLSDERVLEVGEAVFRVIHTPGHTPGGISILYEEEGVRNLFAGDTASAQGRLGYVNALGYSHDDWRNSIRRMLELNPERLFPGHGTFALSGAMDCLKVLYSKWNAPWTNIVTEVG